MLLHLANSTLTKGDDTLAGLLGEFFPLYFGVGYFLSHGSSDYASRQTLSSLQVCSAFPQLSSL